MQNVWGEENVPENALSRKILDPSKRASGLLCHGFFLYRKNRALTPERGEKRTVRGGVQNPFLGGVSFVRFSILGGVSFVRSSDLCAHVANIPSLLQDCAFPVEPQSPNNKNINVHKKWGFCRFQTECQKVRKTALFA